MAAVIDSTEPPDLEWTGYFDGNTGTITTPEDGPPASPEEQAEIARRLLGLGAWPEPEDRGTAVLSPLGDVEYVEDLIRPGRIVAWCAEEGAGKSYAVDDELAIRVAVAGGLFAGTWPIVRNGPVLYLSEMHADDDHVRETTVLASLGLDRAALTGWYYRLPLMTAAGGKPALTVPEWRRWITGWLRTRGALLLIIDTATGATQVDPWGKAIQQVYTDLRMMLDEYPALAIILVLHLKKPQGRGERRISDVLGEWGRWCDVVVIQENDGASLERAKITVRKRVRRERRIIATKAGGLLIDPKDVATTGPKVPAETVMAAVVADPGLTLAQLAAVLDVSKNTASGYVTSLSARLHTVKSVPRGTMRVYPTAQRSTALNTLIERSLSDGPQATAQRSTALYRKSGEPERSRSYLDDDGSLDVDLAESAKDDDAEAES